MINLPTSVTSFLVHSNFKTSARTFQLRRNFSTSAKFSNFKSSFPTSLGSFQLQSVFTNLSETFQLEWPGLVANQSVRLTNRVVVWLNATNKSKLKDVFATREQYFKMEYVQLEKAVGKDEKLESPKLESFTEVGKSQAKFGMNWLKLERTERSWKASFEVGKFRWTWKSYPSPYLEVILTLIWNLWWTFQVHSNFPTTKEAFQLHSVLSYFAWLFLISAKHSNFRV